MFTQCPTCHRKMAERTGLYVFHPPPIFGVGTIAIPHAQWWQCRCGFQILTAALRRQLAGWMHKKN